VSAPGGVVAHAGGGGPLGRHDVRPSELGLGVVAGALVLAGAALALRAAAIDHQADAPEIDRGVAVPVKVVPMLDPTAVLKLGTGAKLPSAWARKAAPSPASPATPAPERAHVSTKAGKETKDIPPAELAVADAGTPPPTDAGPASSDAEPGDAAVGAGEPSDAGAASDAAPGTPGDPRGSPNGTDPLRGQALDVYRGRLIGWFSARFRVSGTGLTQEELLKLRAQVSVQLSADRRVTSYTITPSGNAAFDAAAKSALERAKAEELPPPPENYPDLSPSRLDLTFVCKQGQCS
jgi:hypothetical protein